MEERDVMLTGLRDGGETCVSVAVVGKGGIIDVTLTGEANVEFPAFVLDETPVIVLESVFVAENGEIMLTVLRDGVETGVDVKTYVADMFNLFLTVELVLV